MSRAADRYFNKWFHNQQGEEEVASTVLMSGSALRDAAERANVLITQRRDPREEVPTVLMDQSAALEQLALKGAIPERPTPRVAARPALPLSFEPEPAAPGLQFDFEPFLLDPEADQTEIRTSRPTPPPTPKRTSRAALAAIPIGVLLGALVGLGMGIVLLFAAALAAL